MGHFGIVEAVGLVALLTVEVGVLVVVMIMVMTMAEFVFRTIVTAFDGMYEMVLTEEHKTSEDVRLIDGLDPALQFGERLGLHGGCEGPGQHDAVGGGLDAVVLEQCDVGCFVHDDRVIT